MEWNCFSPDSILYNTLYQDSFSSDSIIFNLNNIDETNNKISGNISLIHLEGYKPNININFSDLPVSIIDN